MEYLTLKIDTARGPIYEKDFTVTDVFAPFVRSIVSSLVRVGLLKEGQSYWATITPCYDDLAQFDHHILKTGSEAETNNQVPQLWLTLVLNHVPSPNMPIHYLRLAIHTLPPDPKFYQRDFSTTEVDYLIEKVQTALKQMDLIRADEVVKAELFVRTDDAPRFNQEVIHALPEELQGVHISVESAPAAEAFPEKAMPVCACGHSGEEPVEQLLIFFTEDGLQRISEYVQQYASRRQETGGILVGDVYREPVSGRPYVEIEDFIPAEQTQADAVSLRFTHETWQKLMAAKQARFPESKRVVGWYHTHPPIAVSVGQREIHTVQFFSADDRAMHRQVFSKPWQVALVMDAESNEKIFFRWEKDTIVESGFHTV